MTGAELTAVSVAVLAMITTLVGYVVQSKRNDQDALASATESWRNLIKPLEARIKHLETEIKIQRDERSKLAERVVSLEHWIRLNTEFDPEHIN